MGSRVRSHIRSNVVGYIAVFLALSGTAYAGFSLPDNSVRSRNIVDGKVKSQDVHANAVNSGKVLDNSLTAADLANGAVNGGKVADNSLTGADINESTLTLPAPEAFHEVGTAGEPAFGIISGGLVPYDWRNYGGGYNTVGFYRDSAGTVHLKGLACGFSISNGVCFDNEGMAISTPIFTLPAGYRQQGRAAFSAVTASSVPGRVDIAANGDVILEAGGTLYVSLEGISFRCSPSGVNGCP